MSLRKNLLLCLCFMAAAVISTAVQGPSSERERLPVASSYSAAPQGCKALYLVLEELGLPVSRFRKPFQNLGSQQGGLIVVDARRIPFSGRELDKLKEWIKSGNQFVLFQGDTWRGGQAESRKKLPEPGTEKFFSDRSLPARRFGLELKLFPESSRDTVPVSSKELEDVSELNVSKHARWESTPQGWTALVSDKAGPVVVSMKMGKGQVIAISDPTMIQNRFIDQAQNVRLIPALMLGKGRPLHILFDEYHHGHALSESCWGYIGSSIFAWIILQSAVCLALFFYSGRAGRVGRYLSLDRPLGRSSLEHVDSMANVFASCKAGSVALEAVLQRFLSGISRKSGVPINRLERDGIDSGLLGDSAAHEISGLIRDCRNAIKSNDDSDHVVRLARRLSEMQSNLGDSLRRGGGTVWLSNLETSTVCP